MKKLFITLISFSLIFLFACGGKDMDSTPDFSGKGPNYFNSDYYPNADTNIVGTPKPFSQTTDLSEPSLDSGDAGKEESIVEGGKE